MKHEGLLLAGISGLVDGCRFHLAHGRSAVVGRSTACDISLRKLPSYLALPAADREGDKPFLTVSRNHVRITVRNSACVEIENLGRHGTFLDGSAVDKTTITDLREKPRDLRLGDRETLRLSWGDWDDKDGPVVIRVGEEVDERRKSQSGRSEPRDEDD